MSDTTTTETQPGNAADATQAAPPTVTAGLTQEQVNAILARERKAWQAQQKREADEAAAAARGEFEKLATERQQRLEAAEAEKASAAERVTTLETTVAALVKDLAHELPEELRGLLPDGPPEMQLDWIRKAKKALPKIAPSAATPPGPRGTGAALGAAPSEADLIARKKASGGYSL